MINVADKLSAEQTLIQVEYTIYYQLKGMVQSSQNDIGGVMVSVFASSAVDPGLNHGRVKPKFIKLVFADFSI